MPPKTHTRVVSSLKGKAVDIIEFGKDLYNEKSIILMPGKGGDKDVATTDYGSMIKLAASEGFVGLAAIFKQFTLDFRKRLILTGHTDTGGEHALNFDLGKKRAEAIYCLLTGKKERWAQLAREKHCIRDYKWIMAYFNYLGGDSFKDDTSCNPWKIDNKWDDKNKTRDAVQGFFKGVKKHFNLGIDDADLAKKVEEDAKKLWPEVIWKAVFDLYVEQVRKFLKVDANGLKNLRDKKMKFAQAGKEFLGCGASFPMKTPDDSKYQKEKYRRVEALFFYLDDVPARKKGTPKIVCIPVTDKLHEEKQCPLYHDKHFVANYLDPDKELHMIAYHMKFDFYNAVQLKDGIPKIRQVPEGLTIRAYHYKKVGAKEKKEAIMAITKYHKGVYTVKVLDDPKRKNIHFEFKAVTKLAPNLERWWVYTKDQNTEPKLVKKLDKDIKALMKPDDYYKRLSYYDLPFEWSSENYWTRYQEGNAWKSGRFQDVLKNKLKLKPYDTKEADAEKPFVFSLDDIVIVDDKGRQTLTDKDKNDVKKALSAASRLALLHVVKDELKLYKPRKSDSIQNPKVESACFSEIDFKKEKSGANDVWRNIITDVPANTRGIIFCNNFYGVFDKRAGQTVETFDPKKMHIKGCRAARLKDPESHCTAKYMYKTYESGKVTLVNGNDEVTGTGTKFLANVEPKYKLVTWTVSGASWIKNKFRYIVKSVDSDTKLTLTGNAEKSEATVPYDAIRPCYFSADGVGNYELHYIHFGSAKKSPDEFKGGYKVRSFLIVYWNGRFKDLTDATKNAYTVTAADVETFERTGLKNVKEHWERKKYILEPAALDADQKGKIQIKPVYFFEAKTADRGGKHKCEVSITNYFVGNMGVDKSKMFYKLYKTYHSNTVFAWGPKIVDIDTLEFSDLTAAHELGHAMGLDDDYAYHKGEQFILNKDGRFSQYYLGMPYHHDDFSIMTKNKAPRMRHSWQIMNRLNAAANDNSELKNLLNGTEYQVVHRFTKNTVSKILRYRLKKAPNDYRDILNPFKEKRKHNTGTGTVDIALYKLGEDEMTWNIKIGPTPPGPIQRLFRFDGILVVFIKLGFIFKNFTDNSDPANVINNNWSAVKKERFMNDIKAKIKELNNRFYLSGTNLDFKNTYIFFFPLCLEYAAIKSKYGNTDEAATKAAANYTIEATFNGSKKVKARPSPLTKLEVGDMVSFDWLAKCILGKDPGDILGHDKNWTDWGNPTPAQAKFTAADFEHLKTWINSADGLNGGAFEVKGA